MQKNYTVTIDFGSGRTTLAVALTESGVTSVVFFGQRPSAGVKRGIISNPGKAAEVLSELLKEANSELGITITQASVALPRYGIRQMLAVQKLNRSDPTVAVSKEEIQFLEDTAEQEAGYNEETETVYAIIPQSFSTEDVFQGTEDDVIGSTGNRLEGTFRIIIGPARAEANIHAVMNILGISASGLVFLPAIEGNLFLSEEEIECGTALIEIGSGVSSVSIYHGGLMKYYGAIPFGGETVSNDIKIEGSISATLADNIKKAYGNCLTDRLESMADKVLIIDDPEAGTSREMPVKFLSQVIAARQKEIIDALLYHIQKSGFADRLRGGIVLIGGGSLLGGAGPMLRDISGYNVRIAKPRHSHIITEQWPVIVSVNHCSSLALLAVSRALEQAPASVVEQAMGYKPEAEPSTHQEPQIPEGEVTGELFTDMDQLIDTQNAPPKPVKKKKTSTSRKEGGNIITHLLTFAGSLFDMSGEKETANNVSE